MLTILRKEFNAFLNSPVAYVVLGVFLVATGLFVWVFPDSSVLDYGYADLQTLFNLAPWIFLFLIPAITMRTFAEEKKAGTMELLLTRPLTDGQILGGKYSGLPAAGLLALLPTLLYYYSVYQLGNPEGNIDSAATVGSYLGLALLAAVFVAMGVLLPPSPATRLLPFWWPWWVAFWCIRASIPWLRCSKAARLTTSASWALRLTTATSAKA